MATPFCRSNGKSPALANVFGKHGPIRSLPFLFNTIDTSTRQQIVDMMCPNRARFFAWNLLPSDDGGSGSVEFRRPPGVATAKKAKHWVAFTMSFVHLALRCGPEALVAKVAKAEHWGDVRHPDFQEDLLRSARELGIDYQLDPRLLQEDDVGKLHITMMTEPSRRWLQGFNRGYKFIGVGTKLGCSIKYFELRFEWAFLDYQE
ncbi:hypothetical protein F4803DRAFT_571461 [Xylaria telfairii]|nr:hypothetical protein F4803DRAFT_571461 [Xylaria telfairii]